MAGLYRSRPRALARAVGFALIATAGGTAASAQSPTPPATAASPASSAADAPPATPAAPPSGQDSTAPAPATGVASTTASKGIVTGYGYRSSSSPAFHSDAPRLHRHLLAHHANEAVATFTGFEMLADGGSRLFVQLSRAVDVAQGAGEKARSAVARSPKKGKKTHSTAGAPVVSSLKFVLKGAEVVNPNNERALITIHFNTPVVRARLAPAGHDLDLLIELRADVTPQMKIVPAKDNGAMLQIDFAPGAYLPEGASDTGDGAADAAGAGASAPRALPTSAGSK